MAKKKKIRRSSSPTHISLFPRWFIISSLAVLAFLFSTQMPITQNYISTPQSVLGDEEIKEEKKDEKLEEKKDSEYKQEEQKKTEKRKGEEEKEENKGSENKQEEQKKTEEKKQEETKKNVEQKIESVKPQKIFNQNTSTSSNETPKTRVETVSPDGVRIKSKSEGNKRETEIETADGQKIKTKVEDDGSTKIEIEQGELKVKYKSENGQIVRKVEDENGREVELEDDELDELETAIDDELEDDDLSLRSINNDKLAVTKNQVSATTDFPLSIDAETKQLVATTPDGQKIITILPDQAVQNLSTSGIINTVDTQNTDTSSLPSESFTGTLTLETRNNDVVYKINSVKTHRMLGFIPVTAPVTAFVSADTGMTVAKQQSILVAVIDFLSP